MSDVANLDILVRVLNVTNAGIAQARAQIRALAAETKAANAASAASANANYSRLSRAMALEDRVAKQRAALENLHSRRAAQAYAAEAAQIRGRISQYGRLQSSFRLIGSTMTTYFTIPALAAAGVAGVIGYKYEKAMQRVQGINRQSAASMAMYRREIDKLAVAVGKSPVELAEGLYYVTSAGFSGAAAMKLLTQAAKGSAIGMGDVQTVADNLTTIINAYGKGNISAARAMNILTAAIRVGKAEPEDFAARIGDVVANAAHLKVPFEQVAGAIADMTLKGINTAQAVTSLNNFMLGLNKGTKAGAAYLDKMGSSYADLRKELATKGLIPTLKHIVALTKGNDEALADIVPNIRSTRAIWGLLSGDGKQLANVMQQVKDSTGESNEAFAKWARSDVGKLERGWAKLLVQLKDAGVKLLPVASELLNVVTGLVDAFTSLPKWAQHAAIGFFVFSAALGPVSTALSGIMAALRTIQSMKLTRILAEMGQLGSFSGGVWVPAAGGKAGGLGSLLSGLSALGPVALTAAAGIAAMVAVAKLLPKSSETHTVFGTKASVTPQVGSRGMGSGLEATLRRQRAEKDIPVKLRVVVDQKQFDGAMARLNRLITIRVRIDNTRNEIKDTKREIEDLERLAAKGFNVKPELREARARLKELQAELNALRRTKVDLTAKLHGEAFARAVAAAKKKADELATPIETVITALVDQGSYQTAFDMMAKLGAPIQKTISVVVGKNSNPFPTFGGNSLPNGLNPILRRPDVLTQNSTSPSFSMAGGASSVTRSAASVANAVKSVTGTSKKRSAQLETAAAIAGYIGQLVDFVNSMEAALSTLADSEVPKLGSGWRAKVRKIVREAESVGNLIAKEISRVYKWRVKGSGENREVVVGKKGAKVQRAAEMTGSIADLLSFLASVEEGLRIAAVAVVPEIGVSAKANVRKLVAAAITVAQMVAAEIDAAFPKSANKKSAAARRTLLASDQLAGPIGDMLGVVTDTISILQTMLEVDPKLFEDAANSTTAWPRLAAIIKAMVGHVSDALGTIVIPDNVLTAADRLRQLADSLMAVLDVMRGIQEMGGNGWPDLINQASQLAQTATALPSIVSGAVNSTTPGVGFGNQTATGAGAPGGAHHFVIQGPLIGSVNATSPQEAEKIGRAAARGALMQFAESTRRAQAGGLKRV